MTKFLPALRLVSVFAVIGLAVGVASAFFIKPKWEAVSVIKQAQIVNPSLSLMGKSRTFLNLEPVLLLDSYDVLVTQLRTPAVLQAVIEAAKLGNEPSVYRQLQQDTRITSLNDAVELRVRAATPEAAISTSQQYLVAIAAEQADWIKKSNNATRILIPVSFVVPPSALPFPVTPQPILIVVVAGCLGAVLGFVVALMWRSLDKFHPE